MPLPVVLVVPDSGNIISTDGPNQITGGAGVSDTSGNVYTNAQASANFCVGKDGTIHMYVDPEGPDAPYANGIINKPAATVQALLSQTGNANPNYWTISVEHEGHSGDALTPAQLAASAQLAAYYGERLGIPPDEDHWLGHYEFDSVTRAGCPGWTLTGWQEWEDAVKAFLAPPVPVPPTPAPGSAPDVASAKGRLKTIIENAQAALSNAEGALADLNT